MEKHHLINTPKKASGFTLFQLVALIVVLGILAATAIQVVVILTPSSWEAEALAEMEKIRCGIVGCTEGDCGFIGDNGAIPSQLQDLLEDPGSGQYCNWLGPYLDVTFVDNPYDYLYDPWGNPYIWDTQNLTLTSTSGGNGAEPLTISLANEVTDLLSNTVQYQFTDANGLPLDSSSIDVYVNYGCGDIKLDYSASLGFYGEGFPTCGLEVVVVSGVDTLHPPACPDPPCDPAPITCDYGTIQYSGSAALSGTMNDVISFQASATGDCQFDIKSLSFEWSGSNWCNQTPYLETFKVGGSTYWDYQVDNNGVRAVSGQEMVLRSTLIANPGTTLNITEVKYADARTGSANPIQLDGTTFNFFLYSDLAPTQLISFTAPGTPPTAGSLIYSSGTLETSGSDRQNISFDITNPGECCVTISGMIVSWDTTSTISYLEEIKIGGTTYWKDKECRIASGQYLALDDIVTICDATKTIELKSFTTDRGSDWGDYYSDPTSTSTVSGSININPNNSTYNQFYLVKTDGSLITRDDLTQSASDFQGSAIWVHVKPKGNGNQNGLTVNGSSYAVDNGKQYDISSSNMTVNLYNDNRSGGLALGQWWIDITATDAVIAENGHGYYLDDESNSYSEYIHRYACENLEGGGGDHGDHNDHGDHDDHDDHGDHNDHGDHDDHGDHNDHGDHSGSSGSYYSPPDCPDDDGDGKITITHYPSGDTDHPQVICISTDAWDAHKAHGDECGTPAQEDSYECSTEKDHVSGNGDKVDMRGHQIEVTFIATDGTQYPFVFNTESRNGPNLVIYNNNIDVSGSGHYTVEFDVKNTGDSPLQIKQITASWDKSNAYASKFKVGSTTYWNAGKDERLSSGGVLDLDNYLYLEANKRVTLKYYKFKDSLTGGDYTDMRGVDFTVIFTGVGDDNDYTLSFTTPGTSGDDHNDHGDHDDHGDHGDHDDDDH